MQSYLLKDISISHCRKFFINRSITMILIFVLFGTYFIIIVESYVSNCPFTTSCSPNIIESPVISPFNISLLIMQANSLAWLTHGMRYSNVRDFLNLVLLRLHAYYKMINILQAVMQICWTLSICISPMPVRVSQPMCI